MKLVQARISEADFQLLHRCAKDEGKSMQQVVREALHARLAPDSVDPDDPLFDLFPLTERRGKPHRLSENHDDYLYGKNPR